MFSFKNVGKEIKAYAEVIGYILFCSFCILAFAVLVCSIIAFNNDEVGLGFLLLLVCGVIAALGYLAARLTIMFTYGYGELIENSSIIVDSLKNNNHPNQDLVSDSSVKQVQNPVESGKQSPVWQCSCGRRNGNYVTTCPCGLRKRDVLNPNADQSGKPIYENEEYIKCPKCNTVQLKGRKICFQCGLKFEN